MIRRRTFLTSVAGLGVATAVRATEPPARPPASPDHVALWASPALADGVREALRGFEQTSGIHVTVTAKGSDLAMAALYTGRTDVALIGRKATDSERQAFEWVRQYPVTEVPAGQLRGSPVPIAVFVNAGNSVRQLSLAQLHDMLLQPRPLTWGDFGVHGALAARGVTIHMPDATDGLGQLLRQTLADGRAQLAWDRVHEHPGDDTRAIVQAVAHDPAAIGFGPATGPGVAVVGIAKGGVALQPGTPGYPLNRRPYLYFEQPVDKLRPAVKAVMAYLADYKP